MKKLILSTILLIGLSFAAEAQNISKNALGLRIGGNNGFGGEISYQRAFSKKNRLEVDLGWRNNDDVDAVKMTGLYQWVWNIEGGFNWYAGVGGGLSIWDNNHYNNGNNDYNDYNEDGIYLFVAGDIGIEYDFKDAPIQISLDLRPEIGFDTYNDDHLGLDLGLGIRYRF
ncbi:MAG TPA: hypothetical protein VIV55_02930 [Flavobacterium sp.]